MTALTLHDYQHVGVEYLRGRRRAGLFLDMGLGKTAIALTALQPEHLPALVIAPKKVAEETWPEEVALWRPDLRLVVAQGEKGARQAALRGDADIVVLGRDVLRDALEALPLRDDLWRTLILDELSSFKSRASLRWKAARRLIKESKTDYVWGLTGTPSPNGYLDLWPQIYLLDNGTRLGTGITAYRSRYFTPGHTLPSGVVTEWLLKPEADKKIRKRIGDICLSMQTEGRIHLPDITFNTVKVKLPPRVKTAYDKMARDLVVDIRDIFGGEIHSAQSAGVLASKLAQMSAGFLYVDDADIRGGKYTELHTAKVDALKDIVEFATSPVLVFYRFKAELEMIERAFPDAVNVKAPESVKRWNRGEIPVMLAHPASAGHGLNLQRGGHTVVWTSLPWSLEEWQQGNKRLHRQGQTNPVVVHVIAARGTVDPQIAAALKVKSSVQKALMDYLESPV